MRIIGGIAKKRKLISPKESARPTSDRIKETLFDVLGNIEGKTFLDLFAGTGNVGIEAISRGAFLVYFVEKSHRICKLIKKNLKLTGFERKAKVLEKEVTKNLFKVFKGRGSIFDIVFADPPYEKGIVKKIFNNFDFGILTEDGIFVLQHSVREETDDRAKRVVRIGDTLLSFFERKNE